MNISQPPINLAIIGCGAIVKKVRLPALSQCMEFRVAALVDSNRERAAALAGDFGAPVICTDIKQLPGSIDAALVATPNDIHAGQAVSLLQRGIHLCVEKPLATTSADCQRLIDAARDHQRVLMTALDRRYRPQYLQVRELLAQQALGAIHRITIREGGVHDWPSASGFYTDLDAAGGGVLLDAGIHALDQLLWWLGEPKQLNYADDSRGGPEAECRLELQFADGVEARLEFSRLRNLETRTEIEAEAGTLCFSPWSARIEFTPAPGWPETLPFGIGEAGRASAGAEGATSLWRDFARSIRTGAPPRATAEDGQLATQLVERCYTARTALARPWRDLRPAATNRREPTPLDELRGQRILVTGGSGFLGGRIVEMLRLHVGAEVNVLTRAPSRAMRVAATGARIFAGDISNPAAVHAAAAGCDLVIHCARDDTPDEDERLRRTVNGTRNVLEATLAINAGRLVHVSSMVVYQRQQRSSLDETSTLWQGQSIYERLKCESERCVREAMEHEGLRAVIVQPTIIYGPHGGWWTRGQLQRLGRRRLVLPAELATLEGGVCNLVYVDDAAEAILLAAVTKGAEGQSFLVSGSQPVTWIDFYRALDQLRGGPGAIDILPLEELLRRRTSEAGQADKSIEYPNDNFLAELSFPAAVDIATARSVLGYQPAFDLLAGMERTRLWAQWAGIVVA